MNRDAINEGFEFEKRVGEVLDLKPVPGSGNKWHSRGDVSGHGLRISCKKEKGLAWKTVRNYLKEAIDFTQGTGEIPLLVVEDKADGEEIVLVRLTDFAKAISEIQIPEFHESKGMEKRAKADIPILMRGE